MRTYTSKSERSERLITLSLTDSLTDRASGQLSNISKHTSQAAHELSLLLTLNPTIFRWLVLVPIRVICVRVLGVPITKPKTNPQTTDQTNPYTQQTAHPQRISQ